MPQDLASLASRCPQLPAAASPLGHPSQHLSHPPVSRPGDEWSQAHRMAELAEPRPSPASSKEEAEAWRKDTAGTARAGSRGAESGFPMKRRVPGSGSPGMGWTGRWGALTAGAEASCAPWTEARACSCGPGSFPALSYFLFPTPTPTRALQGKGPEKQRSSVDKQ